MCQPKWKKKIVESGDVIEEIIYLEKPISIKEEISTNEHAYPDYAS